MCGSKPRNSDSTLSPPCPSLMDSSPANNVAAARRAGCRRASLPPSIHREVPGERRHRSAEEPTGRFAWCGVDRELAGHRRRRKGIVRPPRSGAYAWRARGRGGDFGPQHGERRPVHRRTSRQGQVDEGLDGGDDGAVTGKPNCIVGLSIYVLSCGACQHEYGANGSDIWLRRCPACEGGRPGCRIDTTDSRTRSRANSRLSIEAKFPYDRLV